MSETITKACETCAGVGRPMTWNGTVDCVDCSGTGRVTDVEATLRAEVARLTLREPTQAEGDAAEGTPDEAGNVWPAGSCFLGRTGRRCLDCNRWTWGGPTRCEQCAERAGVDRLTAEANAATTQARIVRLTLASVLGRGHEERDVVELAALYGTIDAARAEVARLTAREREAARILSFVSTSHASAWSAEAEAWLAGCKS